MGLTDVWSAIRSACYSGLVAISSNFSLDQLEAIFMDFKRVSLSISHSINPIYIYICRQYSHHFLSTNRFASSLLHLGKVEKELSLEYSPLSKLSA